MKVKLGMIGLGNIARTFIQGAKLAKNVEVIAGASRSLEKSKEFCEKYDIERAYGSYEDLLNDKDIEGVYIATPHFNHYEICKMCLEAGKNVICEKPLVLTSKDCESLIALAKEKDLLLMEGMWTRFLPKTTKAHEWIDAGLIGDVKSVNAEFSFCANLDYNNRLFKKEIAGGSMYDVGVYVVEFALDFGCSKLKNYCSFGSFLDNGVDEMATIALQFENNTVASLVCGLRTGMTNDAYVYGTEGHIHFQNFYCGNKATLYKRGTGIVEEFVGDNDQNPKGFKYEIEHFADLILSGAKESPRIPHEHNLQTTKIFENLFENN